MIYGFGFLGLSEAWPIKGTYTLSASSGDYSHLTIFSLDFAKQIRAGFYALPTLNIYRSQEEQVYVLNDKAT